MNKLDGTKLFRKFYAMHKSSCGENCVFYTKDNKKKKLDYMSARYIQSRIMKYLYDIGWRMSKEDSFTTLNEQISKYGHIACTSNPLSEKDWFSVSKLLEEDK